MTLLNAFTAGVVVVGLVAGSGIDGTASVDFLFAGFAGLVCLGIWIIVLRAGRPDRQARWWLNPKWWIVPASAVAALALSPMVEDARFEGSRAQLTAFAEGQLATLADGGGGVGCDYHHPPVEVGTYRVTFTCVSEDHGRFLRSVSIHFDDSVHHELDYGDDTITGTRLWHKYATHS